MTTAPIQPLTADEEYLVLDAEAAVDGLSQLNGSEDICDYLDACENAARVIRGLLGIVQRRCRPVSTGAPTEVVPEGATPTNPTEADLLVRGFQRIFTRRLGSSAGRYGTPVVPVCRREPK